jgi:phosphatidylglycerophosphate synthase
LVAAEACAGLNGFVVTPKSDAPPLKAMVPDVPAYTYVCTDRSPLVGPFCRHFVRWFVQWMPPAVPANLLTLGSSACMWVMLGLAMMVTDAAAFAPWCLVLMAGYVIYDHADGMHSRRTGTSSPLGEFIDHYTDAFHGPIAVVVMFLVAGHEQSPLLGPALWAVALAGAASMVEERERKELYFGCIGPLEGMLLTLAFFASWCFPAAAAWWQVRVAGDWTIFEVVMLAGASGSVLTAAACVRRMRRLPGALAAFACVGIGLGVLGWWRGAAWWETPLLLTLLGADYTGRTIASHLQGTPRPRPDWMALVVMAVAAVAGWPSAWAAGGAALFLLGRNLGLILGFLRVFGGYWRWRNPVVRPVAATNEEPATIQPTGSSLL